MELNQPKQRLYVDLLSIIAAVIGILALVPSILSRREVHYASLKSQTMAYKADVSAIDHVLKLTPPNQYLTREKLKEFAVSLPTSIFDPLIENQKTASKPPVEQDAIHRIQLLEIKTDKLEAQIEKLGSSDAPWWKNPPTLLSFAGLWFVGRFLERAVGDLIDLGWKWLAKKIGLKLPKK